MGHIHRCQSLAASIMGASTDTMKQFAAQLHGVWVACTEGKEQVKVFVALR